MLARADARGDREPARGGPQKVAGRYEVEAELGHGGAGAVYRVRDSGSTGKRLALKMLRKGASAKQVALFEREYHTLRGLRHPNIIEVYEYGNDGDQPFYTMEVLEGADVTDAAPLPWPEVCRILRDVASALTLLHARRLLHRDVSARNVWRTKSGCTKLIDFGALTAFGMPGDITGTPPFVAPEALHGQALDQRTDLYALGALGYHLLTGRHAFPVRSLAELPEAWEHLPPSPSWLVSELAREDLPAVPEGIDVLIEALMRRDPRARPASATDLIDQLSSLGSLPEDAHAPAIEGYLSSTAFVGRERERRELRAALKHASGGQGTCALIEGPPGSGRSRLLAELALDAQLSLATVLHVEARTFEGPNAVARALAHKLLDGLPNEALARAKPYASTLGHLSSELRARLELEESSLESMPKAPGEARMRIQSALRAWFFAVAKTHPLAVLVDDVDAVDEGSGAFLAALAREARESAVLVACTLRAEDRELGAAAQVARSAALRLRLRPLTSEDTQALLGSVFGDAPNLVRLAERLHRVSQGNPDHLMRLAEHLVREEVISYREGSWVLPQELDERTLPATRSDVLQARLRQLSEDARTLILPLSVVEGLIPIEACGAVSGQKPSQVFAALSELVQEGLLVLSLGGYRFADDSFREALQRHLSPGEARLAHRRLGELLLASSEPTPLQSFKAGLHLMRGGDEARGGALVSASLSSDTALQVKTMDASDLSVVAPMLEQAVALFRAQGRSKYQLVMLLCTLASLGYYSDRKYAERYGDEAVRTMEEVLELSFIRRASRLLGRKLGLYAGLVLAGVRLRRARRKDATVPNLRECIRLFLSAVTALTGTATINIDPQRALAYACAIKPFTALGENHVASLNYEFCLSLASTVQDRLADAHARWKRLLSRLESEEPMEGLGDEQRILYRAGALYAYGVLESWRDASEALQIADELEGLGFKLYELSADQLRMIYYANQGNLVLSERYRERVEMHAIQRGTAWQVETWAPGALITVYLRTHDARGMKHSMEQLRQLQDRIPSLSLYATRSRGSYLLLRERYEQAAEALSAILAEEPLAVVGWARGHGALARAYNELGQYERARQVCQRALDQLVEGDLSFPALNLGVQLELAVALAGLGHGQLAMEQIAALLAQHGAGEGPLTLGAIHEAGARAAALAEDVAAVQRHREQMEHWYRGTGIPSLIHRCERLARAQRVGDGAGLDREHASSTSHSTEAQGIAYRLRHGGISTAESTEQWALNQLLELTRMEHGFIFIQGSEGVEQVAARGLTKAPEALVDWVARCLHDDAAYESHTTVVGELAKVGERERLELDGKHYRMAFLRRKQAGRSETLGALVVACDEDFLLAFAPEILRALVARLQDHGKWTTAG